MDRVKVEIRGIIVGSEWDDPRDGIIRDYIERGVLTPESKVRRDLDNADGPVTLYINSYGGSVLTGDELANNINDMIRDGKDVEIETGALAASAAANLAVSVNAPVDIHSNTRFMFHGAMAATEGGSEAHEDGAERIKMVNDRIKTNLLTSTQLDPEEVAMWFREGRMGWLGASELKRHGIARNIIDSNVSMPEITAKESGTLSARGLDLAAFIEDSTMSALAEGPSGDTSQTGEGTDNDPEDTVEDSIEDTVEDTNDDNTEGAEDNTEDTGDTVGAEEVREVPDETSGAPDEDQSGNDEDGPEEPGQDETEERAGEDTDEDQTGNDEDNKGTEETVETPDTPSGEDSETAELDTGAEAGQVDFDSEYSDLDKMVSKLQAKVDRLNKALNEKQRKLDETKNALDSAETRLSRVAPVRSVAGEPVQTGTMDWNEALKLCGGDYALARKKYPNAWKAFMKRSR